MPTPNPLETRTVIGIIPNMSTIPALPALKAYKIEKVRDYIYSVHITNKYDRAMTFCRAQEYYESPNPNFKGKAFSIWDYIKWYSHNNGKGFSYGLDWSGFNIPMKTVKECYQKLEKTYGASDLTPYDHTLLNIIREIEETPNECPKTLEKSYLIGVDGTINETFKHEICHGLYSTNKKYNKLALRLVKELKTKDTTVYKTFEKNLLKMGYAKELVDDEIQAYLQFGVNDREFCNGVCQNTRKKLNKKYIETLYDAFTKN